MRLIKNQNGNIRCRWYFIILFSILNTAFVWGQENRPSDDYLRGYVEAVLKHELKWYLSEIQVNVNDGTVNISLPENYYINRDQAARVLATSLIVTITFEQSGIAANSTFRETSPIRGAMYEWLGVDPEPVSFPLSNPFKPLLSDPKEPGFFVSYIRADIQDDKVNIGSVGFGEYFGFYRRNGQQPGDGLQLGISGVVLAQFNLDAPSADLINADYIIGFPITYRRGPLSTRFRIYHQSSHLGDEFLLRVQPERINLSYESMEMLFSYDYANWRGYLGGEYIFHREPVDLKPAIIHGGIEYEGTKRILGIGHFIGGLDLKSHEEHDWSVDFSLKLGVEFDRANFEQRHIRLLAVAYKGYAPNGQFYDQKIDYLGMQLGFGF